MSVTRFFQFTAISLILGLSACGGGGGSSPAPTGTTAPTPQPTTVQPTETPLEKALRTGDASHVTDENEYLDAVLETISDGKSAFNAAKIELFDLGNSGEVVSGSLTDISWNPTHDASNIIGDFPETSPILITNAAPAGYSVSQRGIGLIGQSGDSRYMVFGGNPFRQSDGLSADMNKLLDNGFDWLSGTDFSASNPNIVIAQLDESFYFPDRSKTRNWLNAQYPDGYTVNDATACDGEALAPCLETADVLIVSQISSGPEQAKSVRDTIEAAMANGLPVLYVHHNGDLKSLGAELFDLLKVNYLGDNYWARPLLSNYNPAVLYDALPDHIETIDRMMRHFKDQTFTVDFAQCENRSCPDTSGFETQFLNAAQSVRSALKALDEDKYRMFDDESDADRLEKLWVLLGDHWRQSASFPMDKTSTAQTAFLKSLYADHAAYVMRDLNVPQSDMGTYSRSDFSHITPSDVNVQMTSKKNYKSSFAYAIPGQTVSVTRRDNAPVKTWVQVNSLRSASTHYFDEDGYVRPIFAGGSSRIEIASGETISLTSSYGGPIHIYFDTTGQDVNFDFKNVGSHPAWYGPEDDTAFTQGLQANEYDWAEFSTDYFEITGLRSNFVETMDHELTAGDPQKLSGLINEYHHNIPRYLGGYEGEGITVPNEVQNFADLHGLTLENWDRVQHFNSDQATCGYGCSGNPYDAYWSFAPLGHGDLHEVGHNLETSDMRFSEWSVHASTNWYSYYPKFLFQQRGAETTSCQTLPYKDLFDTLQTARNATDPVAYVADLDQSSWKNGATIMIQLMTVAQHQGDLVDGWMLLPRLHILNRNFDDAIRDQDRWVSMRRGLGFDGMTSETADQLSREDKMMVMASHAAGLNMAALFEMWGITLSSTALDHVNGLRLTNAQMQYYALSDTAHCEAGLGSATSVAIDGASAWPLTETTSGKVVSQTSVKQSQHEHLLEEETCSLH